VTFDMLLMSAHVSFEPLIIGDHIRRAEQIRLDLRPTKRRNNAGR
jgi:hypothetical protein